MEVKQTKAGKYAEGKINKDVSLMCVLGVNVHHDGASYLLHEDEIVAAIEVDRVNQVKHSAINFNNV